MNTYTWILNISLVFSVILYLGIFFVVKKEIPNKVPFKKILIEDYSNEVKQENPDFEYIFKSPLFGFFEVGKDTFKKEVVIPTYIPQNLVSFPSFPESPTEITEDDIPLPEIPVLPPLQILLKGIIVSSNPMHNRVFIENIRTKEEKLYKISDIVDDAQIVSIGKTSVMFIRNNGQQEKTEIMNSFLSEKNESDISFKNIVNKLNNNTFEIKTVLFKEAYPTIGHFLDDLDIITYLENNAPLGCIIGFVTSENIAFELGFRTDDIILSVNGIPVGTAENRISIYELILLNKDLDKIQVTFKRKNDVLTYNYVLNREDLDNQIEDKSVGILESHAERIYYHSPEYKKNRMSGVNNLNEIGDGLKIQSKVDTINQQKSKMGGKEYAIYR